MNTPTQPLIETSTTLGNHLHIVERAGEAAKVALATQAEAQQNADEIKKQWNELSQKFERLRARVTGCREAVSICGEKVTLERQPFSGSLSPSHATDFHYVHSVALGTAPVASILFMQ